MGAAGRVWAQRFADYAEIASDWEGIASRSFSSQDAPSAPRRLPDTLRRLGIGWILLFVRQATKALVGLGAG
jgi:hypothetical protein